MATVKNSQRPATRMMERRKNPRRDWVIGQDETGRAVLEWKVDEYRALHEEADPNAQTFDFLKRLDVPDLELEDDARSKRANVGSNPYDHAIPARRKPRH